MKKRVTAVIMAAMLVMGMAACGNIGTNPEESMEVMAGVDESSEPEASPQPKVEDTDESESAEESTEESAEASAEDTAEPSEESQDIADNSEESKDEQETASKVADNKTDNKSDKTDKADNKTDKTSDSKPAASAPANQEQSQTQTTAPAQTQAPAQTTQPSQSNSTDQVTETRNETPAPTPAPVATPAPHEHSWTPIYETRTTTVVVEPEWFEDEYLDIPIVEIHGVCNQCGLDTGTSYTASADHMKYTDCVSMKNVEVIVGYDHVKTGFSIRHPAVTEERSEQVIVGYTCACGATK